ncbi:CIC11C00000003657 [Sungouiella intermedia]|uniref:CIC11C00000003657 n=1 Tax=Sungouiella intermedia TaxID=45354 RepID=A0A1L0GK33_9ASCO|nr:CIC11C00000003657 [[Candida] intermedia]
MSSIDKNEKDSAVANITSVTSLRDEAGKNADMVVGLDLFEHAQELSDDEIAEELRKIRRKIDWRLLPILCVTYTLQFLDKLSLNYASAYSFKEDLGLTGQKYSWVAAIFNFGYLFWALPSNYIIQKVPIAKYTGGMLVVWAIILIGHIGATNYGGILALRFILGMFEAGISPSCMMICGMFYSREDQPFRMCTFLSCNGIATVVGALLGFGLGHAHNTALASWKLIFLVIGLINFAWSIVFLLVTPDTPASAKFLTERERTILIKHISKNNQGVKDQRFLWPQVKEAALDISIYIFAAIGLGCGVINGGVSNFQSALIKGFGFSGLNATALQMPTGAIEFVVVFASGIFALKVPNTRCFIFCFLCVPGLAGLVGIHLIKDNRWASVGCTWLQYIIGGPVILCWIFMNANIGGSTKKTITNGFWFTLYAAGNIIGANIFKAKEAPKYTSAMTGLITCYSVMIALGISYYFLLRYRNMKRNKEQGGYTEEIRQEAIINGFKGMTDFENKGFRYAL